MAGIKLEFEVRPARAQRRPDEETPMEILVLGDFGGRARKPASIDVDNFDAVMARMAPQLELGGPGAEALRVDFSSIDDFHPDSLHRRVPLFQRIRSTRFEADTQTFARLVGPRPAPATAPRSYVEGLIRDAVAPHVVPEPAPHEAVYKSAIDAALGDAMRALLHEPRFKALEALWRGVYWLVSNLETDESLKVSIADLDAAEEAMAQVPCSLVVGAASFGVDDVRRLAQLGTAASRAGAPFLASAKADLIRAADERWEALRESGIAPWIGLAMPRVLLRRPYGKASEPIESFPFEELAPGDPDPYLWGSGAFACALLIGRAFTARGWGMQPGDELEIEDLPAHTYEAEGEKQLLPCAETALSEHAAQAILDAGVMPLLAYRNRNALRVLRFQSIARPPQALAGRWR